jgi:hypothetical protein
MGWESEARRGYPGAERTVGESDCADSKKGDESDTGGQKKPRYGVTALRRFSIKHAAPEFPIGALPRSVADLVREAAKAIGCPPDAIGLAALTALGSAIGNARVAQPKKGWTEGVAIYAAVIADSGEKKTAAIAAGADVVQELDNKFTREHDAALDEFALEEREYEVDRKDAAKNGLAAPPPPKPPIAKRTHVNDTTIEALIPILKDNPRGLLLDRDELVGWVNAMDQYKAGGKGSDRQFWLSTWSNRPASVDRKSQNKPLSVLRPFVSVIGSIQPSVLPELSEGREDGMMERFLFAFPDPANALWTDDEISDEVEVAYRAQYNKLRNLSLELDDYGDPIKKVVTFSPEAREIFVQEYNSHRTEMSLPGFPQSLRSPWSKLEAYFVRVILILSACRFTNDGTAERIEGEDVLRAVSLMDYFKGQARRVFSALHGFDPRLRLVEDCAKFVASKGGTWTGTATELHEELTSNYKPERPEELSKFLKDAGENGSGLAYESEMERFKDESGEWRSRRVLTLYIGIAVTL